jgi:hypothetical protein
MTAGLPFIDRHAARLRNGMFSQRIAPADQQSPDASRPLIIDVILTLELQSIANQRPLKHDTNPSPESMHISMQLTGNFWAEAGADPIDDFICAGVASIVS